MKTKLTPFGYFGGKYFMADKLMPLFPEHKTYVEVFGGSGAILINKKPSEIEVYNDIDGELYNFFKVIADEKLFKKFQEKISLLPYSRECYYEYRSIEPDKLDKAERAVRFYYLIKSTINGEYPNAKKGAGWRFSIDVNIPKYIRNSIDKLNLIHKRLSEVYIDNLDFRKLIANWDRPDTFFYLDPPYVASSRKSGGYMFEMTDKDHNDLIDILLNIKGKWLLSGYDNNIYNSRLSDFYRQDFNSFANSLRYRDKNNCPERTETVWANYDLNEQGQIPLFAEA
jgi:DNA adenine methylase